MTNKLLKKIIIFFFLALFFIPLNKTLAVTGQLSLAHNDGAQCFLNNTEIFNNLSRAQTHKYWNRTINIDNKLIAGQNYLACRVSNGDGNRGTFFGFFDAELIVNSQTMIPRNNADWKYFGTGGSIVPPPLDSSNRVWHESLYNDNNWFVGSAPFNGEKGTSVLTRAPDNAWFRKSFYLDPLWFTTNCSSYTNRPACLNVTNCLWTGTYCLNYNSATCSIFNNQADCLTKTGCFWNGTFCASGSSSNCSFYTNKTNCLSLNYCLWTGYSCLESSSAICSNFNNQVDCLTKAGCIWTGSYCSAPSVYNCSYQNNRTSCLNTSGCIWTGSYCVNTSATTCNSFITQIDCLNRLGCYWNGSYCTDSQHFYDQERYNIRNFSLNGCWNPTIHQFDKYKIFPKDVKEIAVESARPLITGLVKYGNKVEVFINNNSIGEAVVKEGEYSGVANFYFKPKQNFIDLSKKLETYQIKLVATNPRDNSVCTTGPISFIIIPYPAPIVHRFGEINYVQRANILSISTRKPLITGLVKYGSIVEIYVDNKMVGKPKIKEGEKTGVANFYMTLPGLTPGQHTLYAIAKKAGQEDIESPSSQVYTFTVK